MLAQICKAGIRSYWYLIPKEKRIVCLYKDHCSQHVYNAFDRRGFIAGLMALSNRYKNCNNHYNFSLVDEKLIIKTSGGETIKEEDVSDFVSSGCKAALRYPDFST